MHNYNNRPDFDIDTELLSLEQFLFTDKKEEYIKK